MFLESNNIDSFLTIEFGKNHDNREFLKKKQGYNLTIFTQKLISKILFLT